jgi:hypothetical protein
MCFISYLIGHIIVNFFDDLQVGFEYTRHTKKIFFVTTLALDLRPRQGLARLWAKRETQESHYMLT